MFKKGFTLSELLIALAVVGITVALIAPIVTKIMPDANKAKFIQHYTRLDSTLEEILIDDSIFEDKNLSDTKKPLRHPYNTETFQGTNKFKNIIFDKLNITETGVYKDSSVWTVKVDNNIAAKDYITISIDMKNGGSNCSYKPNECLRPDTFIIFVDRWGDLRAGDALSEAYLENMYNTNDKETDFARALTIYGEKYSEEED